MLYNLIQMFFAVIFRAEYILVAAGLIWRPKVLKIASNPDAKRLRAVGLRESKRLRALV